MKLKKDSSGIFGLSGRRLFSRKFGTEYCFIGKNRRGKIARMCRERSSPNVIKTGDG